MRSGWLILARRLSASVPITANNPANNPEAKRTSPVSNAIPAPHPLLVATGIFLILFLLRLPTIVWPYELNVDESQMLSQAMKFLLDPVPWRSVDGTSSGPLNSLLISAFLALGVHPTYASVHVLATGLVSLYTFAAYVTLTRLCDFRAALWGIVPMVLCFGFSGNPEFLHYSSELLPAFLLAIGFYWFLRWSNTVEEHPDKSASFLLFLCGLSVGLAPWCKLQAVPLSLTLAATTIVAIARNSRVPQRSMQIFRFCASASLPSILFLLIVFRAGVLVDCWNSYVLGNLAYAGSFSIIRFSKHLASALFLSEMLPLTSCGAFAFVLYLYIRLGKSAKALTGRIGATSWILAIYLLVTLFAVARPAYFFLHYTVFLLFPASCLITSLLWSAIPHLTQRLQSLLSLVAKSGLALIATIYVISLALQAFNQSQLPRTPDASEKIAAVILRLKSSNGANSLAIWGWTPGVYVDSGMPPATRDAIGHFVISKSSSQTYFRHRFVTDMRRSSPDIFVDSVAPGAFTWTWNAEDSFESDPALRDFVQQEYVLASEVALSPGAKPVRVFLRRSLAQRDPMQSLPR